MTMTEVPETSQGGRDRLPPEKIKRGTSLRLDGEQAAKVDRLAAKQRRSRSNMIRVLLSEALEAYEDEG